MKHKIILILLTFLPLLSIADGYWLDIEGSGKVNDPVKVSVYYGGVDDDSRRYIKNGAELNKLTGFKVHALDGQGNRIDITIQQMQDHWEGSFKPETEGTYQILAIHETLPVVDRSETSGKNVRPIQYLCAAYQVGSRKNTLSQKQFLDIITSQNGKTVNINAFINQKPAAKDTKLRVFNPENWEKLPVTDVYGKAYFIPTMKGMYIVRVDWVEKKPGIYQGLPFESIRHRCDYSLLIP